MRRVESLTGFVVAGGVVAVAARSRPAPRWTTPLALVIGTAAGWATGRVLSLTPHKPVLPALVGAGVALIAVAALTSVDAARAWPALGGLLVTISAFGSYATLPDTERALSLLGAAGAITIAGVLAPRLRLNTAGLAIGAGAIVVIALLDGANRDAAVLRGFGCLGVLLLEPLARRTRRALSPPRRAGAAVDAVAVVAVHLMVVGTCAGLATHRRAALAGLFVVLPVFALGFLALLAIGPQPEPASPAGAMS